MNCKHSCLWGANTEKRAALQQTSAILTEARAFFLDFLLTHNEKLTEKMVYYSEKHQELRERLLSAEELRSWLEQCTVSTKAHPHVSAEWDFKARFPGMPAPVRRAAMKEAIGKARAYLTAHTTWQKSGKKKGRPGLPGAADHPTFYQGAFEVESHPDPTRERGRAALPTGQRGASCPCGREEAESIPLRNVAGTLRLAD
jgi:hypothetical protein